MLSSSTWVDARALKYAQKKYRYRNPYFDRRYRGLVKIAVVIGLLGAGILYKNRRAVEKRLHPLLLSRDDDAQYGNEYDFSHELAGRHASHPERPEHEKSNEVCSTGLLSDEGRWPGVRACCAPHCSKCAASEDKACNAPGIIKSGIFLGIFIKRDAPADSLAPARELLVEAPPPARVRATAWARASGPPAQCMGGIC